LHLHYIRNQNPRGDRHEFRHVVRLSCCCGLCKIRFQLFKKFPVGRPLKIGCSQWKLVSPKQHCVALPHCNAMYLFCSWLNQKHFVTNSTVNLGSSRVYSLSYSHSRFKPICPYILTTDITRIHGSAIQCCMGRINFLWGT
jgi:hypothetical protein